MFAFVWLEGEIAVRLTVALVHFAWQGCALAAVAWLAGMALRRSSAQIKYVVHVAVLLAMAACIPLTFALLEPAQKGTRTSWPADSSAVASFAGGTTHVPDAPAKEAVVRDPGNPLAALEAPADATLANEAPLVSDKPRWRPSLSLASAAPSIVAAWWLGALAMLIRLIAAIRGGERLRREAELVADPQLLEMLHRQVARLGLTTVPALAWCAKVSTPVVVGLARPVVLLPASLASGLAPQQVEVLLAHELAHIRRFDLIVNLLQRVIEAVLFFHPAVWFVSRRVSGERENACDDAVLAAGWDRLSYADALLRMAEFIRRGALPDPQAACLGAGGENPSQFKRRVLRVLGEEPAPRVRLNRGGVGGLLAAVLLLGVLPIFFPQADAVGQAEPPPGEAKREPVPPVQEWLQFGGSSQRNHVSPAASLPATWDEATKQNIAWKAPLGTFTFSSPVVTQDKVLIGTNNGAGRIARFPKTVDLACLQCFDRASGKFLWQYSSEKLPTGRVHDWPEIGLCSTPCLAGDRLWVVTNRCEVLCLDLNGFLDGENDGPVADEKSQARDDADVVWRFDMLGGLGVNPMYQAGSSPTLAGDLVLLNTSHGPPDVILQPPASQAPSFVAVDRHSGQLVWSDNSPGENILPGECPSPSPAVATLAGVTQAIFAGGDGWLYSFDVDAMRRGQTELLWKFDGNDKSALYQLGGQATRNAIVASPVICDDGVFVAMGQNPEHGEGPGCLWRLDPTRRGDISPDLVYNQADPAKVIPHKRLQACVRAAGDFTRPNPNSGVVWRYQSADRNGDGKTEFEETLHRSCGSPTIAKGLAFVADLTGILHCLDARTGRVYWTHDLMSAAWGTPLIADGRIYVGDEDGDVTIFELAREKAVLAEINVNDPLYGSPCAVGDALFLATKANLYSLRRDDRSQPAAGNSFNP